MSNSKATRRALLTSVLALVMCVSMLIGTTAAWFTDTVTSSGNKIISGTLKVDLQVLNEETGAWDSVKANKNPIFNYENWEPGYVQVKVLRVVNLGSLALKWQAALLSTEELGILADVIDVYVKEDVVTYPADRNEINSWTKLGTLRDFVNSIPVSTNGEIKAKENSTDPDPFEALGIAFKMQETANNDYQNKTLGSFDIQILATQMMAEDDSFDNKYDEDAVVGKYVELPANGDLLAALASADADQPLTIKLLGDVEWNTLGHGGVDDVTPASSVIIYGGGNTLTAVGSGVTPFGDKEATFILKNLNVVDESVSYAEGAWEFSYLEIANVECYNVSFNDPIMVSGNAKFVDCSFVGYYDAANDIKMNGAWVYNGENVSFTNCDFTGTRGIKICDMYSANIGTVVIDNCLFSGLTQKPGIAIDDEGTLDMNITIKNSTFINCQPGDQGLYVYETDDTVPTVENNTVINGAISGGRIENNTRYQIAADFAAEGVKTLAFKVLDQNGELITTITPEAYTIPADGKIGDYKETSQNSWNTTCCAVTGNSSSWQHTAFTPSTSAKPTKMVLVINGYDVAECGITEVVTWVDVLVANGGDTVKQAGTVSDFNTAISGAKDGDTIIVTDDIDLGSTQLSINKDVAIDLNGNELNTANNWGGIILKGGASIKNGVINHTGNTAAIKVSDSVGGSIENVVINMTPTANKTKTGIQVYNGKYIESIKNVTITGVTQGIEVKYGSRVDLIENVTVVATAKGENGQDNVGLLVDAASVGKAVNCSFTGDYGVIVWLRGEYTVALELEDCVATGSIAALWAHDEAGIPNTTNCSFTLKYDAATEFNGPVVTEFDEEDLGVVTIIKP